MYNPADLLNWAVSKVEYAVENGLTLKGLHDLMNAEFSQRYQVYLEKFLKANARVSIGKQVAGQKDDVWARVNITSATQRLEVPPSLRKAIWMDTLAYMIGEGIQLETEGMFQTLDNECRMDREAADALTRPRTTPVTTGDLPF